VPSRSFVAVLCLLCLLAATASAPRAQDLLPLEQQALAARAAGQTRATTDLLLQLLTEQCARPGDATTAARIEAWATFAARATRPAEAKPLFDRLDALQSSPAATADPLLADRLALCALEVAERLPDSGMATRMQRLGFVRAGWLLGPLPNERGSGFAKSFPPESKLDLDAPVDGKVRPVHWRQVPARALAPTLPLHRLVQPLEQSLAYFAVALVADAPGPVVLELGSTGAFAVFCNGSKVLARDVERVFQYDQDAVALPLQRGANLLLVKACHQEGNEFVLALRLRQPDGRPSTVRVSAELADLTAAAGTTAVAANGEPAAVPLGGRTTFAIGAVQGADALRLAWLWRAREADGDRDADRRDRQSADAARQAVPDCADAWLALAAAHTRVRRAVGDRDENDRRRALEQALRCSADHVEALTQLGNLLRDSSTMWRQARDLAERALRRAPTHPAAGLLRIATLRDEGLAEFADAELRRFAQASDHPDAFRQVAAATWERDPAEARAMRERVLTLSSHESDVALAAGQLARCGRGEDGKALLARALAADPWSNRLGRQLAELQLAEGDAAGAAARMLAWLALAPDDADAMVFAARCLAAGRAANSLPDPRELELLREALQIEPNRRDDERHAEFLARQLDGAASAEATAFHAPWQVDAAKLVAADPGPPADAAAARDPLHWLLRQQITRANRNGTTNTYTHQVVRVLTPDGARALSTWRLQFYGGEQRARMLACTVFRADGTVQKPALQASSVRLPDLRPGDVVAVEGRVDDVAPTYFGDYFGLVHVASAPDGSPVRADDLLVLAAPGRDYRWQNAQGAPEPERETLADGTLAFRWRMRDLPRDRPEVQRPERRERDPVVRMTTYRDWDQFAAWWWNLIKNQLEVTPAMRATVQEKTAGLTDVEAKIAALYHFVTTDVRYEAWEFGVHGYKPYATSIIHDRRHGDCKDKALLLCALLGEIGVPCRPVLIFADPLRTTDDLDLPMVQHFNHCIAWLPPHDGRPGRFLDGTATWHPTDTLPDMDQGASVLVVDAGKAELRPVPWTTPAANVAIERYTVELGSDGKAVLQHAQLPRGNAAVGLRAMLATEPARRREVVERSLTETVGKAALRDLRTAAKDGPELPVELAVDATLDSIGQRTDTTWQLPSSFTDTQLLGLTAEAERHAPLLLGVPVGESTQLRYVLPPGWRAGELPAAVAQQTPFGSFTMRWRLDGSAVVVDRELQMLQPRIDPKDHAAFRDFVTAVKAADSQLVLLQKEGAR
jgi:hypothetical protein